MVPTPNCPACGQEETLEHLWCECPKWAAQRDPMRTSLEAIREGPPCTRLCAVPHPQLPEAVLKRWRKIQECFAQILHARMKLQGAVKPPMPPPCLEPSEAPLLGQPQMEILTLPSRPLNFRIRERLNSGRTPWPFDKQAWRNVCFWASQIRVSSDPLARPPTLLEALLSYIVTCKGCCLVTRNGPEEGGGSSLSTTL